MSTRIEWLGWHFLPDDGCLRWGSKEKVEVGKTLRITRQPVLCEVGFHASRRAIDALGYAPGALVCRVRLGGIIVEDHNKAAAQERTVLWMADATKTLHEFACDVAEDALKLIDKRDPRSIAAIETKRKWLRGEANADDLAAARDAAQAAAWAVAAWDAARPAAWEATQDAAWARYNDLLTPRLLALPHPHHKTGCPEWTTTGIHAKFQRQ
jgi:hypothetical protein